MLIKEGRVSFEEIYWLNMVSLSKKFGWTPSQIKKEKQSDMKKYLAVLNGSDSKTTYIEERELV